MQPRTYEYETGILIETFNAEKVYITHTQIGITHYVKRNKNSLDEQYIIAGEGAKEKAHAAFNKWVAAEVK